MQSNIDFSKLSDAEIESILVAELKKANAAGKAPAAGYARVSTDKDEQEKSKENQVYKAKEFIDKQGWHPVFIFPTAESGYKDGRKYFYLMLDLCNKHNIKYLVLRPYRV